MHPSRSNFFYYHPQRSCGKVIFLQVSVSHSVHRGISVSACTTGHMTGGGLCPGGLCSGGVSDQGVSVHGRSLLGRPPLYGTYPTGMHSCLHAVFGQKNAK